MLLVGTKKTTSDLGYATTGYSSVDLKLHTVNVML